MRRRPRFVALFWTDPLADMETSACDERARKSGLDIIAQYPATRFFGDRDLRWSVSDDGDGIVIGSVFENSFGGGCCPAITLSQASLKPENQHRSLQDHVWGEYIGFTRLRSGQPICYRSPAGQYPCYVVLKPGLWAAGSDVAAMLTTMGLRANIEVEALAQYLMFPSQRVAQTCLENVQELLPGCYGKIGEDAANAIQYWSPWSFSTQEVQVHDFRVATETTRTLVQSVVATLANQYNRIVVGASGGLDSSIVAACLRNADVECSLLSWATSDASGNELEYARLLANHLGLPLMEATEDISLVDLRLSAASDLPRPTARAFAQSGDHLRGQLIDTMGVDAFFDGGGGDNVFFLARSALPVIDRFRNSGLSGCFETIGAISEVTSTSYSKVVQTAIARSLWPRTNYVSRPITSFLSGDVINQVSVFPIHPWLVVPADIAPGKAMHVAWILGIQNYLDGFPHPSGTSCISPLMAQPLIEQCLRIPTWLWFEGGRDRAVARAAFSSMLPPTIVNRRTKGTPDSFVIALFENHRPLVREMLMDGCLRRHGLLDVEALDRCLSVTGPVMSLDYARIMSLVDAEAWAQSWIEK